MVAEITNELIYEEPLILQEQIYQVGNLTKETLEICRTTLGDLREGQMKIGALKRKHGF